MFHFCSSHITVSHWQTQHKIKKKICLKINQRSQPHFTEPRRSHLACGHEEGEDEDEDALGHRQPVGLLQGEEDGSVQTGFGRAAETKDKLSVKPVTANQNNEMKIRIKSESIRSFME